MPALVGSRSVGSAGPGRCGGGWVRVLEVCWAPAADVVGRIARPTTEAQVARWGVVFPSPAGKLRDPSNTQSDLRKVFDRAGYPEITSHTCRRTVATLMDRAGLSARAAADQLGHAKVSMTQDECRQEGRAKTGAAKVLEAIDRSAESRRAGYGFETVTVSRPEDVRGVSPWLAGPRERPLLVHARVASPRDSRLLEEAFRGH